MHNVLVERRKYLRLEYVIPVSIKIKSGEREKVYQGFSRDISFGGIGIEFNTAVLSAHNEIFKKNDTIQIEVEFPKTGDKINATGAIRWKTSDDASGKIFFGIEFSPKTDPEDVAVLYSYAKREIRNKVFARKLFSLSIIAVMFLSLWGVRLQIRNTVLLQQIHKLDVMRVEMEKNLISLRFEKTSLQSEIKKVLCEKKSLDSSLIKLKEKALSLNNIIIDLENRLNPDEINTPPDISLSKNKKSIDILTETTKDINSDIDFQIDFIEKKLSENENILNTLKNRYENLDKTLSNRLKAKKFLDEEIKFIAGRTTTTFSSLFAMNDMRQSGYDDMPRCIWALDPDLYKFRSKTDTMLEFCKNRNIKLVFAGIDFSDDITVSQLPDIIKRAHNNGINIHAYYVMNRPIADKNRLGCLNWVGKVLEFNKSQQENDKIDGINIEINTDNLIDANKKDYVMYLEMLEKLVISRNNKNSALEIGVTVKNASGEYKFQINYKGILSHFNSHVIDLADYILIEKLDSMESAKSEITHASTDGKKVFIGEHLDTNNEQYNSSLSGQYINDMETDINSFIEYYLDQPSFMGVSINDYASYSKCIDDNTPEYIKNNRMPVISRRPPKIEYKGPAICGR